MSYEGPEGLEEAVGPIGPQDAEGTQGPVGTQGNPGIAGVATVTIQINGSDYSLYRSSLTGRILWYEAIYQASEIATEDAENGALIGYGGYCNYWVVLPDLGVDFTFETGSIELRIDLYSSGDSPLDLITGANFRFVIVFPPSTEMMKGVDNED